MNYANGGYAVAQENDVDTYRGMLWSTFILIKKEADHVNLLLFLMAVDSNLELCCIHQTYKNPPMSNSRAFDTTQILSACLLYYNEIHLSIGKMYNKKIYFWTSCEKVTNCVVCMRKSHCRAKNKAYNILGLRKFCTV